MRIFSVRSISPMRLGSADHNNTTAPTTCGPAIEVPLSAAYPLPGTEDKTSTPGAAISGFMRFEPSAVTGPRLLKSAILPLRSIAPTEKTESYKDNGELIVLQLGPSLPVDTATKIPASRK